MSETISETRLIDLKLPLTHDSASYSCNEYAAMCQNADIKEKLLRGIRAQNSGRSKEYIYELWLYCRNYF
jgi:hypothetical protein